MVQVYFTRFDMPISICSFICSLVPLQLPEQLKKYYKTWNANRNEANSVQQNQTAYKQLMNLLAVRPGAVPRISVEPHTTLDQQIDPNRRRTQVPSETSTWQMGILLDNLSTQQTAIQFQYGDRAPQPNTSKGKKRALPDQSETSNRPLKKSRIRTCAKCKRTGCPGAFLSRPCGPITAVCLAGFIHNIHADHVLKSGHQATLHATMGPRSVIVFFT
jgi:hypothetical protein